MLQDAVSSGTGYYTALGGKQIGRYCLAEIEKWRIAKSAIADQKGVYKVKRRSRSKHCRSH